MNLFKTTPPDQPPVETPPKKRGRPKGAKSESAAVATAVSDLPITVNGEDEFGILIVEGLAFAFMLFARMMRQFLDAAKPIELATAPPVSDIVAPAVGKTPEQLKEEWKAASPAPAPQREDLALIDKLLHAIGATKEDLLTQMLGKNPAWTSLESLPPKDAADIIATLQSVAAQQANAK